MNYGTIPDMGVTIQRLKAIADEKRLLILQQLAGGERCVCELTDALEAGQSLLSFHLKTLKSAGLVVDRRAGRWVHYSINPAAFEELEALLADVRASAADSANGGACCE